jgi:uncharacterized protein (TIGR02996 family)
LFANPDDLASHTAYAVYLSEQGDPRGEFIQVQLALEDEAKPAEEREKPRQREQELLDAHQREWLGPLAPALLDQSHLPKHLRVPETECRWRWARGWVEEIYLWQIDLATARALASCPMTRLLRRLQIDHSGEEHHYKAEPADGVPEGSEYPNLYPLARSPFLPSLRAFQLGETVDFEQESHDFCQTAGEGVAHLVGQMARLEELHLLAHHAELGQIFALPNLTNLRVLLVYHEQEYPLEVLAANPALRNLTTLRLRPGPTDGGSRLPLEGVRALVHSPHLVSLKELHLHGSDLGDEGCEEIVRSGTLRRLEVLDLRFGRVGDEGARVLAECPNVRRLRHLSLEDNELTYAGRALLHGLGIDVRCNHQFAAGSDGYL